MRCFVAVDLPDDVRAAVAAAQETWRAASPRADVSWVEPAKLHLTLEFLGETDDALVPAVQSALADVVARHAPFAMTAGGAGQFPMRGRPRVLWVGLTDGLREIGLLAAAVERACMTLGFPLPTRPFRGHVTIGRVRSPRGVARIVSAMEGPASSFGAWAVREVVLYRSHLGGVAGSRYEALARLLLHG